MRHAEENLDEMLDRHLALFKTSSHPLPDATRDGLLDRLRAQATASIDDALTRPRRGRRWLTFYAVAAAVAVLILGLAIKFRPPAGNDN